MKTYLNYICLAAILLLTGTKLTFGHDEFTRVIKKDFTVNPDAQLIIDNKFGKVHCNNWDKNEVSVEVKVTVEAPDEKSAQKIFERITISFTGSPSQVEARTVFEEGKSFGKNRVNIDYTVNMPTSINLNLTNKYGDIFINELGGKGNINLAYGNLNANKFNNSDNLLDIKFSKADIKWMKGAVVSLKYSDLRLDYAGSMHLDSKYSNLEANKIIALNVNFEGGKLNMENSSAVDSKSKFSDIEIERIETSLSLDIQYGNCDVHEMPAEFNSINIRNKYANISIGLAKNATYILDADLKFCDIDYPEDEFNFTQRITTNTSKTLKGIVGKESNPAAKVTVRSEFGNISLK